MVDLLRPTTVSFETGLRVDDFGSAACPGFGLGRQTGKPLSRGWSSWGRGAAQGPAFGSRASTALQSTSTRGRSSGSHVQQSSSSSWFSPEPELQLDAERTLRHEDVEAGWRGANLASRAALHRDADSRGYSDFNALLRGEFSPHEPAVELKPAIDWDRNTGHRVFPPLEVGDDASATGFSALRSGTAPAPAHRQAAPRDSPTAEEGARVATAAAPSAADRCRSGMPVALRARFEAAPKPVDDSAAPRRASGEFGFAPRRASSQRLRHRPKTQALVDKVMDAANSERESIYRRHAERIMQVVGNLHDLLDTGQAQLSGLEDLGDHGSPSGMMSNKRSPRDGTLSQSPRGLNTWQAESGDADALRRSIQESLREHAYNRRMQAEKETLAESKETLRAQIRRLRRLHHEENSEMHKFEKRLKTLARRANALTSTATGGLSEEKLERLFEKYMAFAGSAGQAAIALWKVGNFKNFMEFRQTMASCKRMLAGNDLLAHGASEQTPKATAASEGSRPHSAATEVELDVDDSGAQAHDVNRELRVVKARQREILRWWNGEENHQPLKQENPKTKLCNFVAQGTCPNGDSCVYAHSLAEMNAARASNDSGSGDPSESARNRKNPAQNQEANQEASLERERVEQEKLTRLAEIIMRGYGSLDAMKKTLMANRKHAAELTSSLVVSVIPDVEGDVERMGRNVNMIPKEILYNLTCLSDGMGVDAGGDNEQSAEGFKGRRVLTHLQAIRDGMLKQVEKAGLHRRSKVPTTTALTDPKLDAKATLIPVQLPISEDKPLGFEVTNKPGELPVVAAVDTRGALNEWNTEHPELQVKPGDKIVTDDPVLTSAIVSRRIWAGKAYGEFKPPGGILKFYALREPESEPSRPPSGGLLAEEHDAPSKREGSKAPLTHADVAASLLGGTTAEVSKPKGQFTEALEASSKLAKDVSEGFCFVYGDDGGLSVQQTLSSTYEALHSAKTDLNQMIAQVADNSEETRQLLEEIEVMQAKACQTLTAGGVQPPELPPEPAPKAPTPPLAPEPEVEDEAARTPSQPSSEPAPEEPAQPPSPPAPASEEPEEIEQAPVVVPEKDSEEVLAEIEAYVDANDIAKESVRRLKERLQELQSASAESVLALQQAHKQGAAGLIGAELARKAQDAEKKKLKAQNALKVAVHVSKEVRQRTGVMIEQALSPVPPDRSANSKEESDRGEGSRRSGSMSPAGFQLTGSRSSSPSQIKGRTSPTFGGLRGRRGSIRASQSAPSKAQSEHSEPVPEEQAMEKFLENMDDGAAQDKILAQLGMSSLVGDEVSEKERKAIEEVMKNRRGLIMDQVKNANADTLAMKTRLVEEIKQAKIVAKEKAKEEHAQQQLQAEMEGRRGRKLQAAQHQGEEVQLKPNTEEKEPAEAPPQKAPKRASIVMLTGPEPAATPKNEKERKAGVYSWRDAARAMRAAKKLKAMKDAMRPKRKFEGYRVTLLQMVMLSRSKYRRRQRMLKTAMQSTLLRDRGSTASNADKTAREEEATLRAKMEKLARLKEFWAKKMQRVQGGEGDDLISALSSATEEDEVVPMDSTEATEQRAADVLPGNPLVRLQHAQQSLGTGEAPPLGGFFSCVSMIKSAIKQAAKEPPGKGRNHSPIDSGDSAGGDKSDKLGVAAVGVAKGGRWARVRPIGLWGVTGARPSGSPELAEPDRNMTLSPAMTMLRSSQSMGVQPIRPAVRRLSGAGDDSNPKAADSRLSVGQTDQHSRKMGGSWSKVRGLVLARGLRKAHQQELVGALSNLLSAQGASSEGENDMVADNGSTKNPAARVLVTGGAVSTAGPLEISVSGHHIDIATGTSSMTKAPSNKKKWASVKNKLRRMNAFRKEPGQDYADLTESIEMKRVRHKPRPDTQEQLSQVRAVLQAARGQPSALSRHQQGAQRASVPDVRVEPVPALPVQHLLRAGAAVAAAAPGMTIGGPASAVPDPAAAASHAASVAPLPQEPAGQGRAREKESGWAKARGASPGISEYLAQRQLFRPGTAITSTSSGRSRQGSGQPGARRIGDQLRADLLGDAENAAVPGFAGVMPNRGRIPSRGVARNARSPAQRVPSSEGDDGLQIGPDGWPGAAAQERSLASNRARALSPHFGTPLASVRGLSPRRRSPGRSGSPGAHQNSPWRRQLSRDEGPEEMAPQPVPSKPHAAGSVSAFLAAAELNVQDRPDVLDLPAEYPGRPVVPREVLRTKARSLSPFGLVALSRRRSRRSSFGRQVSGGGPAPAEPRDALAGASVLDALLAQGGHPKEPRAALAGASVLDALLAYGGHPKEPLEPPPPKVAAAGTRQRQPHHPKPAHNQLEITGGQAVRAGPAAQDDAEDTPAMSLDELIAGRKPAAAPAPPESLSGLLDAGAMQMAAPPVRPSPRRRSAPTLLPQAPEPCTPPPAPAPQPSPFVAATAAVAKPPEPHLGDAPAQAADPVLRVPRAQQPEVSEADRCDGGGNEEGVSLDDLIRQPRGPALLTFEPLPASPASAAVRQPSLRKKASPSRDRRSFRQLSDALASDVGSSGLPGPRLRVAAQLQASERDPGFVPRLKPLRKGQRSSSEESRPAANERLLSPNAVAGHLDWLSEDIVGASRGSRLGEAGVYGAEALLPASPAASTGRPSMGRATSSNRAAARWYEPRRRPQAPQQEQPTRGDRLRPDVDASPPKVAPWWLALEAQMEQIQQHKGAAGLLSSPPSAGSGLANTPRDRSRPPPNLQKPPPGWSPRRQATDQGNLEGVDGGGGGGGGGGRAGGRAAALLAPTPAISGAPAPLLAEKGQESADKAERPALPAGRPQLPAPTPAEGATELAGTASASAAGAPPLPSAQPSADDNRAAAILTDSRFDAANKLVGAEAIAERVKFVLDSSSVGAVGDKAGAGKPAADDAGAPEAAADGARARRAASADNAGVDSAVSRKAVADRAGARRASADDAGADNAASASVGGGVAAAGAGAASAGVGAKAAVLEPESWRIGPLLFGEPGGTVELRKARRAQAQRSVAKRLPQLNQPEALQRPATTHAVFGQPASARLPSQAAAERGQRRQSRSHTLTPRVESGGAKPAALSQLAVGAAPSAGAPSTDRAAGVAKTAAPLPFLTAAATQSAALGGAPRSSSKRQARQAAAAVGGEASRPRQKLEPLASARERRDGGLFEVGGTKKAMTQGDALPAALRRYVENFSEEGLEQLLASNPPSPLVGATPAHSQPVRQVATPQRTAGDDGALQTTPQRRTDATALMGWTPRTQQGGAPLAGQSPHQSDGSTPRGVGRSPRTEVGAANSTPRAAGGRSLTGSKKALGGRVAAAGQKATESSALTATRRLVGHSLKGNSATAEKWMRRLGSSPGSGEIPLQRQISKSGVAIAAQI